MKMMDPDSPFFLSINYARKSGKAWYKRTPMGINKLYSIMNDRKAGASLQTSDKRLTPYRRLPISFFLIHVPYSIRWSNAGCMFICQVVAIMHGKLNRTFKTDDC